MAQARLALAETCLCLTAHTSSSSLPQPKCHTQNRRALVDEEAAALWALKAKHKAGASLTLVPADREQPPEEEDDDACLARRRRQHGGAYTAFVRSGRAARERRHLTRPEGGGGDRDIGLPAFAGLAPPRLRPPAGAAPLWTAPAPGAGTPQFAAKAPPAAALAGVPLYKERPETAAERADCAAELAPADLARLRVAPRVLDFGRVSTAAVAEAALVVTNPLARAVHIALDTSRVPELSGGSVSSGGASGASSGSGTARAAPLAQVVPAGATAKFPLSLRAREFRALREALDVCVNGAHFFAVEVAADARPVAAELSAAELDFAFGLDDWGSAVEQPLLVSNPHAFPIEWALESSSAAFAPAPASGTLAPGKTEEVVVRWRPSAAPPAASGGGAGAGAEAGAGGGGKAAAAGKTNSKKPAAEAAAAAAKEPAAAASAAGGGKKGGAKKDGEQAGGAGVPPDDDAPLMQTATLTVRLRGGADAPQTVALTGQLPGGTLKLREKEVALGPVPVGERQTAVVTLRNAGSGEAAFRVCVAPSSAD